MESYFGDVRLVRLLVQRALAALYLIAFLVAATQFKPLLGEHGLLPVPALAHGQRWQGPSLFRWRYSDRLLDAVAWGGVLLSALAVSGLSESGGVWLSIGVWLLLWALYLSIVNVGQSFYGFGWESMLLEAGFFAAFLGPAGVAPSPIPVLILRWMLFRTEIGAGLIKLRHDRCWRDLTCLFYHYETQPLPNPLSWYFHHSPKVVHRLAVLFSHFVQVVVPFGLFAPQPFASIAGGLIVFHQVWLIASGNYSWLNWLTVALGVTAFNDAALSAVIPVAMPQTVPRSPFFDALLYAIGATTAALSIQPVLNLFSKNQLMNYTYNPLHLVNTYGAFGGVTRKRYEIVLGGTEESEVTDRTQWKEYGFEAKPGDPCRMPPQVAPCHPRLDWMMWFLPFSVTVTGRGIAVPGYETWFLRLVQRLLEGDAATLKLLRDDPFRGRRPTFVQALIYEYRYTSRRERRETGAWWVRREIGVYLPPVSLAEIEGSLA